MATALAARQRPVPSTTLQDGRFLVLERLGRGGMGAVYRAFDRAELRLVALKVVGRAALPLSRHPLSAEFEAWTAVRHPNVVRAYELNVARHGPLERGRPYLVLEHVGGPSAQEVLGRERPLDAGALTAIALQLLRALDAVHASGWLHRDLKPANVLVRKAATQRPLVKLTDFGLAVPSGVTRPPGIISGSLPYVAPEALLGHPLDARSDLYALGILIYQLATGRLPMDAGNLQALLAWHLRGPRADPEEHRASLPPRLLDLVRRLTERDRDRRPATAMAALELIGSDPRRTVTRALPIDRGERAALRLALDAIGGGAVRSFELPAGTRRAAGLIRAAALWAQTRGLRFLSLAPRPGDDELLSVGRLVLRLLNDGAEPAAWLVRRHKLQRHLPLQLFGELTLLDRVRAGLSPASAAEQADATARVVAGFIEQCAERLPLVLHWRSGAHSGPLVRNLDSHLRAAVARRSGMEGGGWLLLSEQVGAKSAATRAYSPTGRETARSRASRPAR